MSVERSSCMCPPGSTQEAACSVACDHDYGAVGRLIRAQTQAKAFCQDLSGKAVPQARYSPEVREVAQRIRRLTYEDLTDLCGVFDMAQDEMIKVCKEILK